MSYDSVSDFSEAYRAGMNRPHLDARLRHLISVAAAVAAARDDMTRFVAEEALRAQVHSSEIYEVILQGYLTGGFPRTINAFMAFRDAQSSCGDRWRPAPAGWDDPDTPEEWLRRGKANSRRVYENVYPLLEERITSLSPDLFHWLMMEGYGKVLGRPGLPFEDREICLLAGLVVLAIPRQTRSHLRGALLIGFTSEQIDELFHQTSFFTTLENLAETRAIWNDMRKRTRK